ncbi:hypothetical protein GCM10010174_82310 [Kutzneria viridogrisea]|uniref:ABM domain-containing protein n=2 Tax=Kutzneria TaxID=43356 RepID=W5WG08_9PSEU|nr:antibiotic biosynthesis monooxygenase family protein [Kutzneria albida]AHI00119.1 hypothetical protein KALB_6760 [Kutzneria albida DSM 43870]MBA8925298.1 quinol monooxygenase YgiN [Kutzneria viridogrisea]
MILTIAEIRVRPGCDEAFVAAHRDGAGRILATPGCRSARLTRSVEDPDRFLVISEWDCPLPHEEHLSGWSAVVGEYLQAPAVVEHHTQVLHHRGEI